MFEIVVDGLPTALREAALGVAERLHGAGHQAWIVGGAVRDLALGITPDDMDLCTDAVPDRIEALFDRTVGVGKAFGTVVVVVDTSAGPVQVELTTFRLDGESSDGRHPDRVEYGASLEEDAARRDFTINALFLDPRTGETRDPTGGLTDLAEKRIRSVGNPAARFDEDALRLMRLARFAGRFDFEIESVTRAAARDRAPLLGRVSRERIANEWRKASERDGLANVLRHVADLGLLAIAAPGAERELARRIEVGERLLADRVSRPLLSLGLLFGWLFDPLVPAGGEAALESPTEGLKSLRPSKAELQQASALWSGLHTLSGEEVGPQPSAAVVRLAREPSGLFLALYAAARAAVLGAPTVEQAGVLERCTRLGAERLRPAPLLQPKDLIEAGVAPGPRLGELLTELEDLQLEGRLVDLEGARRWLTERLRD